MANSVGSINFDDGLKRYEINGNKDCVITFNPSDAAMAKRMEKLIAELEAREAEFKSGDMTGEELDKEVRRMIDYALNAPVSEKVFGNANCVSPCLNGKQLYMNFLDALMPVLKADINEAVKKTGENINSYTSQVVDE